MLSLTTIGIIALPWIVGMGHNLWFSLMWCFTNIYDAWILKMRSPHPEKWKAGSLTSQSFRTCWIIGNWIALYESTNHQARLPCLSLSLSLCLRGRVTFGVPHYGPLWGRWGTNSRMHWILFMTWRQCWESFFFCEDRTFCCSKPSNILNIGNRDGPTGTIYIVSWSCPTYISIYEPRGMVTFAHQTQPSDTAKRLGCTPKSCMAFSTKTSISGTWSLKTKHGMMWSWFLIKNVGMRNHHIMGTSHDRTWKMIGIQEFWLVTQYTQYKPSGSLTAKDIDGTSIWVCLKVEDSKEMLEHMIKNTPRKHATSLGYNPF